MNFSVQDITSILTTAGTLLSSIVMLITLLRVIRNIKFRPEVIYGKEADLQYESLIEKRIIERESMIPKYKYDGGKNKIFNSLEFSRYYYNKMMMSPEFKGCKKRIRYFYKNDDNEKWVKTWYLK